MRNKLLNGNLTDSISKGGVLYRPGEIPVLTKEQLAQANLVSKLPHDFPFANWEGMTTKQQLQQMKYSGLNPQEQWSLLNANVPLGVLKEHNQAQEYAAAQATPVQAPALLSAKAVQALAQNIQNASTNSPISPSLQSNVQNGQLGRDIDAFSANVKSASSPKDAPEQSYGTISAKVGGKVSAQTRNSDQTPTPTQTPNPNKAPLPEPAPSPSSTPNDSGSTQNNRANEAANADTAYQKDPIEYLFGIDTSLLSEESRKSLYNISRKLNGDGVVPLGLYNSYLNEISRIQEEIKSNKEAQKQEKENAELEEEKAKYFEEIKAEASSDVTWGTEMIYNQGIYNKVSGTFGPWGNIPEKVCGAAAIHNVNQILGLNTRFDDLLFLFNQNSLFTTNLFGSLGVRPGAIEDFYKAAGLEVTRYDDPAKVSKNHDAYVVKFLYPNGFLIFPGGHYVAAEYDKKNDCFYVYNNFVHDEKEKWETLSPSSYKESADKYMYNGKSFDWTIWGIDKPKQASVKKTVSTPGKGGPWRNAIK